MSLDPPAPPEPRSSVEAEPGASPGSVSADGAARASRPPRRPTSARALPIGEAEIDSPTRLTLVALGSVVAVTMVCWGAAKASCNLHPPESRPPPVASTEMLAGRPKDAAVELEQRWAVRDFAGALQLAEGPVAEAIRRDQAECAKSGCPRDLRAVTSAVLHRVVGITAQVTVTTRLAGEGARSYDVELHRVGPIWKATRHNPIH